MSGVLFSARHHDNGRECRVIVTEEEARAMRVFYKRLGYIVDGEVPGPRIATRNPARRAAAPKVTREQLIKIITEVDAPAADKVALLQALLKVGR